MSAVPWLPSAIHELVKIVCMQRRFKAAVLDEQCELLEAAIADAKDSLQDAEEALKRVLPAFERFLRYVDKRSNT